jgi:hypothetical protein
MLLRQLMFEGPKKGGGSPGSCPTRYVPMYLRTRHLNLCVAHQSTEWLGTVLSGYGIDPRRRLWSRPRLPIQAVDRWSTRIRRNVRIHKLHREGQPSEDVPAFRGNRGSNPSSRRAKPGSTWPVDAPRWNGGPVQSSSALFRKAAPGGALEPCFIDLSSPER